MLSGTHRNLRLEQVTYGAPAAEALIQLAAAFEVRRLLIITSRSLAVSDGLAPVLAEALGELCVGIYPGVAAHSPREAVVEGAHEARRLSADMLVAVGGGSVIDATKAMQLCLWHDLRHVDDFDLHRSSMAESAPTDTEANGRVRMTAIPTALSAAEFTMSAALTHRGAKEIHSHPLLIPRAVILDPAMTLRTPTELWFSTGLKAIDHAVEQLCNPVRAPFADALAADGLSRISQGLAATAERPSDLDARLECQFGMWLAISGATAGRGRGASHAIGHTLGGLGVPHGLTSCVTLSAVLRWNQPADPDRQRMIAQALGYPGHNAGDAVETLCKQFGLPTTLGALGVGRDRFPVIAEKTMTDPGVRLNPRQINGPEDIIEILELAA